MALPTLADGNNCEGVEPMIYRHCRARMAQPITEFRIVEVAKPKLGELKPSSVRADVKVHLNVRYVI